MPNFEFADIGYDTQQNLWFVQMFNETNQNVGFHTAKKIELSGCAVQCSWKDTQARPFWHVRERFTSKEVKGFSSDVDGNLKIEFEKSESNNSYPENYSYVQYAYHLTSQAQNQASYGFVEFCDADGKILYTLNNRLIIVEDAKRLTIGSLPKIRIKVLKEDIEKLIVTKTAVVIVGS